MFRNVWWSVVGTVVTWLQKGKQHFPCLPMPWRCIEGIEVYVHSFIILAAHGGELTWLCILLHCTCGCSKRYKSWYFHWKWLCVKTVYHGIACWADQQHCMSWDTQHTITCSLNVPNTHYWCSVSWLPLLMFCLHFAHCRGRWLTW
jgi:hypothetical protein